MKRIAEKAKVVLLVVSLSLVWIYHGGCIQTKNYRWEPTEEEKQQMIEKAAEKIAEKQLKEAEK